MKKFLSNGLMIIAVSTLLTACTDELDSSRRYDDGMLHFMFTMDDDLGHWTDGSTTRMAAPVALEAPEGVSDTLYLHCEVGYMPTALNTTTTTRGQRLTGDVFGNGINTFGLYARIDGDGTVVSDYTHKLRITDDNFQTISDDEGDWHAKKGVALQFPGDTYWRNQTVSFYGFAPFPDSSADEATCISVGDDDSGQPTLTFRMLPDEAQDKDILTACATGVTKQTSETKGIELRFHHVLTALKFRFADDDNNTTDDVTARINGTDYYIKVTAIDLEDVYSQGTCPINDAEPVWTPTGAKGSTTITAPRNHDQMANDHLLNTDEHCLMVMPQKAPDGARLSITCDLYADDSCTGTPFKSGATFAASVAGETWEAGHSYTYTLSKNAIVYNAMFSSRVVSTLPGAADIGYNFSGGKTTLAIKSAKEVLTAEQAPGEGTTAAAPFHVEYSEFVYDDHEDPDDLTGQWSAWTSGVLPYGYYLQAPDGKAVRNLKAITPTSTDEQTYTLVAAPNVAYPTADDRTKAVLKLRTKQYTPNSTDGYYDLSYQADATRRNTANCYMIDGYGRFKLPLVYGNAIANGLSNPRSYEERNLHFVFQNYNGNHIKSPYIIDDTGITPAQADIVWEDEFNLIDNYDLDLSADHGYLRFEIKKDNIRPGNAIVCVKDDSGTIMWSWHIWVTNINYDQTTRLEDPTNHPGCHIDLAPYNLGKRESETITTIKPLQLKVRFVQNETGATKEHKVLQNKGTATFGSSSLYYQYGRKDPMPALVKVNGETHDAVSDIKGFGYHWELVEDYTDSKSITIADGIRNPSTLYTHYHTVELSSAGTSKYATSWHCVPGTNIPGYLDLGEWDREVKSKYTDDSFTLYKTIFDPCPVGFTVPPRAFIGLFKNVYDQTHYTYTNVNDGLTIPHTQIGNIIRFYRAGMRGAEGGYKKFPDGNQGLGYYWAASAQNDPEDEPYTGTNSFPYYAQFSLNGVSRQTDCSGRSMSIRPVKEQTLDNSRQPIEANHAEYTMWLMNPINYKPYRFDNADFADEYINVCWRGISAGVLDYYGFTNPKITFRVYCKSTASYANENLTISLGGKAGTSGVPSAIIAGNSITKDERHVDLTPDMFGLTNAQMLNIIRQHPNDLFWVKRTAATNGTSQITKVKVTIDVDPEH